MNFNSPEFLVFFTCVLLLYALVFHRACWRDLLLLFASYFFYMSWNWKYAGLLALSTGVDYTVGRLLNREQRPWMRKWILVISLTSNLGLLALFKYYNFFMDIVQPAITVLGWDLSFLRHELLLPVGISFYTFQTMSYTIDVYRGERVLERDFLKFAVFVSFFPQLIAGPIVRAKQFLPQLHRAPNVTVERFHDGLLLVFRGLFKKVVIADLLATLAVDKVFAEPLAFSSWDLVIALYAYAFQIYYDFSGYSDIAIGLARMLGYDLPVNFNRPYISENVREFWTRWHISLSTWLRDYLYIPLGGNRSSPWRVRMNLMITMLLGGLWHGAALHFVFWGAYHGILLMLARSGARSEASSNTVAKLCRQIACFHLIAFGWLLFRVQDMQNFLEYVQGWSRFSVGSRLSGTFYLVFGLGVLLHVIPMRQFTPVAEWWIARPVPVQAMLYAGLLVLYCGLTLEAPSFIYFQF
ncbi:MAG: MBOAT family protein [Nitrospira defluvii]|nr:MBOAT family protein [Nitrospira defluvii]